ncbi:MAG: ABC transporter permease [Defluviitaleaceae bacterium]|nr:ABC transporter permease [Defluviitaleaceae bacterium]
MRIVDVLGMSVRNLYKRKMRTFLTLLGVMIGTASIILMISLGLATDAQFAQMMEDMNLDMTVITVWPQWGGMGWDPNTDSMVEFDERELTDESAERISRIPGVVVATPMMTSQMLFRTGPYFMAATVTGIRPEALALMGYNLEYGRFFTDDDEFAVVFSTRSELGFIDSTTDEFWSNRMWMDDPETLVDIHNDPIRAYYDMSWFWNRMGWGGGRGGGFGGDDDFGISIDEGFTPIRSFDINMIGVTTAPEFMWSSDRIYMHIEDLQTIERLRTEGERREREEREWNPHFSMVRDGDRQTYGEFFVRVRNMDDTRPVAEAIRDMGYRAHFDADWIEHQRRMNQGMETLLIVLAVVCLVLAAITIAITMITSVTERTSEIGLMKVIGATISDVRKLFLMESLFMGLLGGVVGIVLALGISFMMNNFEIAFLQNLNMGAPIMTTGAANASISLITPWLCGLALLIAGGVGLVGGYYPAWRATRLSALAAIRGE